MLASELITSHEKNEQTCPIIYSSLLSLFLDKNPNML